MSETVDLTLLSGSVLEIVREIRLMRLQLDNVSARLAGHDGRFQGFDVRFGELEMRPSALQGSFHELVNETARGCGQHQQQLTRLEMRLDAVDVGLAELQDQLASGTSRILQAMEAWRPG